MFLRHAGPVPTRVEMGARVELRRSVVPAAVKNSNCGGRPPWCGHWNVKVRTTIGKLAAHLEVFTGAVRDGPVMAPCDGRLDSQDVVSVG